MFSPVSKKGYGFCTNIRMYEKNFNQSQPSYKNTVHTNMVWYNIRNSYVIPNSYVIQYLRTRISSYIIQYHIFVQKLLRTLYNIVQKLLRTLYNIVQKLLRTRMSSYITQYYIFLSQSFIL